jgi:hypothetical protein
MGGVTKNEEMDLVEGSTTAEMEEAAGAGLVESPAPTLGASNQVRNRKRTSCYATSVQQ